MMDWLTGASRRPNSRMRTLMWRVNLERSWKTSRAHLWNWRWELTDWERRRLSYWTKSLNVRSISCFGKGSTSLKSRCKMLLIQTLVRLKSQIWRRRFTEWSLSINQSRKLKTKFKFSCWEHPENKKPSKKNTPRDPAKTEDSMPRSPPPRTNSKTSWRSTKTNIKKPSKTSKFWQKRARRISRTKRNWEKPQSQLRIPYARRKSKTTIWVWMWFMRKARPR